MNIKSKMFRCSLLATLALFTSHCDSSEYGGRSYEREPDNGKTDREPGPGPDSDPTISVEGSIPIHQVVTVGCFEVVLGGAQYRAERNEVGGWSSYVAVDFVAHNNCSDLAVPFGAYTYSGLLLDIAGAYSFGELAAGQVPGLKKGEGTITWFPEGLVNDETLRGAVVSIGGGFDNQVVVPLGNPEQTQALMPIQLSSPEAITGFRDTTLRFDNTSVEFSDWRTNTLVERDTALLVVRGEIRADQDMGDGGAYWQTQHIYLTQPNGISIPPESFSELIFPGDLETFVLVFHISQPLTGEYRLGVYHKDLASVETSIVMP